MNGLPVALYYEILDFQKASLKLLRDNFELITLKDPSQDSKLSSNDIDVIFAPMGFLFNGRSLGRFPQLKAIVSPTTGLPHIDEPYMKKNGIKICSLKDEQAFLSGITPTAELAFGFIIALTRQLLPVSKSVRQGEWDAKKWGARTPQMLSNMSLGIVGLGRLGGHLARYAESFGMHIHYYDPHVDNPSYRRAKTLLDLAAKSQIVSLHIHASPKTQTLINDEFISTMQRGSYLINTSRGSIVDESALLKALKCGHLAGAALDTLDGEHHPEFIATFPDHPLLQHAKEQDNLILTPKIGGRTRDAWEITEARVIQHAIRTCEQY